MKKIILILILASFSATLAQFDTTEVTETYGMDRKVIDLSGKWKVSNDEGDTWSSQHVPSTSYDNSTLIYKKTIKLAKRDLANRTYHLEVNGISDNGEFYVNNQFLGSLPAVRSGSFSLLKIDFTALKAALSFLSLSTKPEV